MIGRNILDELDPREKEKFDYDENTHTYTRKEIKGETKEVPTEETKGKIAGRLEKVMNDK